MAFTTALEAYADTLNTKHSAIYLIVHYIAFSQDYNLTSHSTQIVCVNFIHEWRNYISMSIRAAVFCENFHDNFIYFCLFAPILSGFWISNAYLILVYY